jgi:hypothetical protein
MTVPHLAALQNLRQVWADARARVSDSHKADMNSLGVEASEPDEMGDIGISGDHTVTNHNYYQQAGGLASKLLPLALAAGVGLAAPFVWDWCKKPAATPTTPPAVSDNDWKLGLEVKDTP